MFIVEDIRRLDVRNAAGDIVPVGTLVRVERSLGAQTILRYNLFPTASITACRLRFRPTLMTAISSIAGFMPLVVAAGAGAASRQAIGTAVVGGMLAATVMSLVFTPVFYVAMQRLSELRGSKPDADRGRALAQARGGD